MRWLLLALILLVPPMLLAYSLCRAAGEADAAVERGWSDRCPDDASDLCD